MILQSKLAVFLLGTFVQSKVIPLLDLKTFYTLTSTLPEIFTFMVLAVLVTNYTKTKENLLFLEVVFVFMAGAIFTTNLVLISSYAPSTFLNWMHLILPSLVNWLLFDNSKRV
jgi:hypothetical protein